MKDRPNCTCGPQLSWFSFVHHSGCRYYGLQLWFPEYFKLLLNGGANVTHPCSFTRNLNCTQLEAMFAAGNCDKIYQNTLWETLATVPGTILGILTINLVGGRAQLCES